MSDLIRCERCRCLTSPRLRPDGCRICVLEVVPMRPRRTHIATRSRRVPPARWLPRSACERQRRPVDNLDDDNVGLDWWLSRYSGRLVGHANGIPIYEGDIAAWGSPWVDVTTVYGVTTDDAFAVGGAAPDTWDLE